MPVLDPTRLDPVTLLGRDELPLDWSIAKRELAGARVLVTGAGGSVGARLAEMLLDLGPALPPRLHVAHKLRRFDRVRPQHASVVQRDVLRRVLP